MKWLAITAFALTSGVAMADGLPSGLRPELREVLVEEISGENWVRFRFVLPELSPTVPAQKSFEDVMADFEPLCAKTALPYIAEYDLAADKVMISLADRLVDFGVADPDAVQFFELFRIENSVCIWEGL